MRFSSGPPRRRAHSNERFYDRVLARVTANSDRLQHPAMQIWRALKLVRRLLCFSRLSGRGSQDHAVWDFAGRNHSPQGDEQFAGKGGLNLPVTAIILWNTRYLERAVAALRQAEEVPDHLLAYLSPLGWEHINLTRDYIWPALVHNSDHGRSLRA